jgi:hypothetical protein
MSSVVILPAYEKRVLPDPFAAANTDVSTPRTDIRREVVVATDRWVPLLAAAIFAFCLSAGVGDTMLGGRGRSVLFDRIMALQAIAISAAPAPQATAIEVLPGPDKPMPMRHRGMPRHSW